MGTKKQPKKIKNKKTNRTTGKKPIRSIQVLQEEGEGGDDGDGCSAPAATATTTTLVYAQDGRFCFASLPSQTATTNNGNDDDDEKNENDKVNVKDCIKDGYFDAAMGAAAAGGAAAAAGRGGSITGDDGRRSNGGGVREGGDGNEGVRGCGVDGALWGGIGGGVGCSGGGGGGGVVTESLPVHRGNIKDFRVNPMSRWVLGGNGRGGGGWERIGFEGVVIGELVMGRWVVGWVGKSTGER